MQPEDCWGGDFGAVWRFKERMRLEGGFFTQYTTDSIHWYSGGGTWRPENVGAALFFGLESRLRFDFPVSWGPLKKIGPSLSCQYLKSYLLSYGYTFSSGKRIPYMPEYTLGAALDIAWSGGALLLSAHYESLRYADTANLSPLEPPFLLNAVVNQELGRRFTAFCVLRNLLNRSYESFSAYPMPGLTITLGINASFDVF